MHAPYILVNKTGYDLQLWGDYTGSGKDTELKQLLNGQEIAWRFGDWRVQRESTGASPNKLSLQLTAAWESLKGISVDKEGTTSYILRPTVDGVSHRLVCQVKLRDNVKIVTFRSATVLFNATNIPLEVVTINSNGQITSKSLVVNSGEEYSFPIESSFSDRILIRPQGFGYHWSREVLYWKELQREVMYPLISCISPDSSIPPFIFQINSVFPAESLRGFVAIKF